MGASLFGQDSKAHCTVRSLHHSAAARLGRVVSLRLRRQPCTCGETESQAISPFRNDGSSHARSDSAANGAASRMKSYRTFGANLGVCAGPLPVPIRRIVRLSSTKSTTPRQTTEGRATIEPDSTHRMPTLKCPFLPKDFEWAFFRSK